MELLAQMKKEVEEAVCVKQKLTQKDSYIQNQSNKIIKFQSIINRLNQDLTNLQQANAVIMTIIFLIKNFNLKSFKGDEI